MSREVAAFHRFDECRSIVLCSASKTTTMTVMTMYQNVFCVRRFCCGSICRPLNLSVFMRVQTDFKAAITGSRDARSAGSRPPMMPMTTEKIIPFVASHGVMRNSKTVSLKELKLIVPVE